MQTGFYQPAGIVTGPAYGKGFKLIATVVCAVLAGYGITVGLRYPLLQYGLPVQLLLLGAAVMLGVSYYWFLRSAVVIDARGMRQTWMFDSSPGTRPDRAEDSSETVAQLLALSERAQRDNFGLVVRPRHVGVEAAN